MAVLSACGPGVPQLGKSSLDEVIGAMTLEEKAHLVVGTGMAGFSGDSAVIGATRKLVPGAAGTTYPIERLGIPAVVLADGPAGLRIDPKREGDSATYYCTHFPIGTLLASTWDQELVESVGQSIGNEVLEYGADVLLAPALNIHRNPLCGRNFEYYSEDGVLGGHIAANIVNGLQEEGVYAFIKHFVLNDQETNRCALLLTYTDEQPMREIYLKPFEMSVKNFEGQSLAVMSSFNFIGDIAAGANPNLLNTVLRDEWGFEGMVLSDWNGSYGYQNTDDFVRNGNDAMLGFMQHESNQITNTGSATLVKAMRQACKNIFYTVVNSGNYTIPDPNAGKMDNMTKMFIGIDVGVAVVALGAMAVVLIRWNKKRQSVITVEKAEEKK